MLLMPEAQPKTAFCMGRGLCQFEVLCFGLCNTPAKFEHLMERALEGIPRQCCMVFLDDVLAHGSSFHSAVTALRTVLEKIRAAGLKLHPNICYITFLGHCIGSEGIGTAEDKVTAVVPVACSGEPKRANKLPGFGILLQGVCTGVCLLPYTQQVLKC